MYFTGITKIVDYSHSHCTHNMGLGLTQTRGEILTAFACEKASSFGSPVQAAGSPHASSTALENNQPSTIVYQSIQAVPTPHPQETEGHLVMSVPGIRHKEEMKGRREEGREGVSKGGREGGREGGKKEGRKGGRE